MKECKAKGYIGITCRQISGCYVEYDLSQPWRVGPLPTEDEVTANFSGCAALNQVLTLLRQMQENKTKPSDSS